jgi:hypothetical protein
MATCTGCGAALAAGDQFCGVCGTRAVTPAAEPPAAKPPAAVTVEVPEWLTADWGYAAKWALTAALAALIAHYIVLVVLYLGLNVLSGFDLGQVDWGAFLQIPIQMMLAMHGAVEGSGTWLTGIAWIAGSLYITRRVVGADTSARAEVTANPWVTVALRAVKVGLVYACVIIVGVLVFDPEYVGYQAFYTPTRLAWNAAGGFFLTLLIVSVSTSVILLSLRRRGHSSESTIWAAGFRGTLRILFVGAGGIFTFFLLAGILELITNSDDFFKQVFGGLLILLVGALAWTGIDVGLFFMVEAMRFFTNDAVITGHDVFGTGGSEGWFLVATLIVAVAFALGGYRAARLTNSREIPKMAQAAAVAGGGIALVYLLATVVVGDTLTNLSAGIGLSILWTAVAIGGALIYAQSIGVLQKVSINVTHPANTAVDATEACPNCGASRMPDQAFCAGCGTRL